MWDGVYVLSMCLFLSVCLYSVVIPLTVPGGPEILHSFTTLILNKMQLDSGFRCLLDDFFGIIMGIVIHLFLCKGIYKREKR